MGHNASKVLMGMTQSSFRHADPVPGTVEAGLIVRLKTDGIPSVVKTDGEALGISLGKDLSNINYTSVVRSGLRVPLQLTAAFVPVVGTQVNISDTTGKAVAAGAGATGMNAVYRSGALTQIKEDGTEVAATVCLIDMQGGL